MMMSSKNREWYAKAIPWVIVAVMASWSTLEQRWHIGENTRGIKDNAARIAANEMVLVIEVQDRFTRSNFTEWERAFLKANPCVVRPSVEFSEPPTTAVPLEIVEPQ